MNRTKKILLISLVGFFLISVTIFFLFWTIYHNVKANCLKAQREFGDDCVNSLLQLANSEDKTFRERNSAIWALGQLADKEALLFLYELEKALPEQEKCRSAQYLCKYEVQKAIKWCERGNITSWMYRNRENWR